MRPTPFSPAPVLEYSSPSGPNWSWPPWCWRPTGPRSRTWRTRRPRTKSIRCPLARATESTAPAADEVDPLPARAVYVVDVEAAARGREGDREQPALVDFLVARRNDHARAQVRERPPADVAAHHRADPPRALRDDHRVLRVRRASDVDRVVEVPDRHHGRRQQ